MTDGHVSQLLRAADAHEKLTADPTPPDNMFQHVAVLLDSADKLAALVGWRRWSQGADPLSVLVEDFMTSARVLEKAMAERPMPDDIVATAYRLHRDAVAGLIARIRESPQTARVFSPFGRDPRGAGITEDDAAKLSGMPLGMSPPSRDTP
jgi:hypothetical protein